MKFKEMMKQITADIEDGQYEEAANLILKLENEKESAALLLMKAALLEKTGDLPSAEAILRTGLGRYPNNLGILQKLGSLYNKPNDFVKGALCYAVFARHSKNKKAIAEIEHLMKEISRLYVVYKAIRDADHDDFVIISDSCHTGFDTEFGFIANVLRQQGNHVFFICPPADNAYKDESDDIHELIKTVFANREEKDGITVLKPPLYIKDNVQAETLPYILKEIVDNHSAKQHVNILCRSKILDAVRLQDTVDQLGNKLETIFAPTDPENETILSYAFLGDFSRTLDCLYSVNFIQEMDHSGPMFSIVIPTRNNAESLQYTLQTCLHQKVQDFEIIISDNSSAENKETQELIQKIADNRIKYFRPERELQLKENFEFAYLKAKGEFVFSIGSDDAVLFNGLETLQAVLEKLPNDDILFWDRLFYCWPSIFNKSQKDIFAVPGLYQKGKIEVNYYNCTEFLNAVMNLQLSMYTLPTLYINSGFRRRYIKKVIDKTGKFLDGYSQDIYTGLMNLALNDRFPILQYPITIAGMSSKSIGTVNTQKNYDKTMIEQYTQSNKRLAGDYLGDYRCQYLPDEDYTDIWLLFHQFIKIAEKHISDKFQIGNLDLKKMYAACVSAISGGDDRFRSRLHQYYQCIQSLNNTELTEWFETNYWNNPDFKGTFYSIPTEKAYAQGFGNNNALTLDASRFGVTNVYEACELFDKLYNL